MTTVLDPSTWPADDVAELIEATSDLRGESSSRTFSRACIVASTGPLGAYAGKKALEAGGSAVDAALATAFTQIASAAGCWVSYAGIFTMVHFEAGTGEVTSLDGGFRTFRDETEPSTIPTAPTASGRTALVPGFLRGAEAAHRRFGRLPWADLLRPAIWIAEGISLGTSLAGMFQMRQDVIARTPEGRAALMSDGRLPDAGEMLRQPELARTLRKVAEEGADYLYAGEWAHRFVEVVRREGGKATLEDLSDYQPVWGEPLSASIHGLDIYGVAAPNTGGAALIEGLKIAAELNVGDPQEDPEAAHLLTEIARTNLAFTTALDPTSRVTDEHTLRLAKRIQETGRAVVPSELTDGSHSDFVCVVDEQGNAVAVCHSINTGAYGSTGLFVDGVSIPDAASFQQFELSKLRPGDRLPHPMNPAIVIKGGAPVLASSSIGAGLHQTTLTCVHRHLAHGVPVASVVSGVLVHGTDYGVPISDSINNDIADEVEANEVEAPNVDEGLKAWAETLQGIIERREDMYEITTVEQRDLPQSVTGMTPEFAAKVEAFGTRVAIKAPEEAAFLRGYWGGIAIDPKSGSLEGARTALLNSRVEGLDKGEELA